MIQLIVCDIDNTLVPKHKKPSENTLKCIHDLHERGILFGLASGRNTSGLRQLASEWGIHCDILIGNNGGEYQDELTGEYFVLPDLSAKQVEKIFSIMEPFKDQVNTQIFVNGVRKVRRLDEQTMNSIKYTKNDSTLEIVKDESEFWQNPTPKIGFRTPAEIMKDVEERVAQFPSDEFKGFKTEFTMFEFTPVEADKGKLLKYFCEKHSIPIENAMGIGDMTNDVSLIAAAGIGVCMENGSDDAKAVADIITEKSIEDDGWAYFIENNVLNNLL